MFFFLGAPSPFPTNQEAIPLQKHVQFSDYVESIAEEFRLDRGFVDDPYLAIHMRHGSDWVRKNLFCMGQIMIKSNFF